MNAEDRAGYPPDFPWDGAFVVPEVQGQPWWTYPNLGTAVDTLWLLGDDSNVDGAFGRLMHRWGQSARWFAAGTSSGFLDSGPGSWTAQWPGFGQKLVGWDESRINPGPVHRTEWWQVHADPGLLAGFIQGPLLHPENGFWLTVTDAEPDPQVFVRASMGLTWWRSRNERVHAGAQVEEIDYAVESALLCLMPHLGHLSAVALNRHPVPGVVFFGSPAQIAAIARAIGNVPISPHGREVAALLRRGCWLATG